MMMMKLVMIITLVIALIRARQPESKLVSSPCSAITFHSTIMMMVIIMVIMMIMMVMVMVEI